MKNVLEVARRAAIEGGQLLKRLFVMPPGELETHFKAQDGGTPQTIIDLEVGSKIAAIIRENCPDHAILDEEMGVSGGNSDWLWFIDSFDGTSNALCRFPLSVVGVSVSYKGEVVIAVVGNPFEDELTFAEKGAGCFVSKLKMEGPCARQFVSPSRDPKQTFAELDALFNAKTVGPKTEFLRGLVPLAMNVRMTGSGILGASHLAQGKIQIWMMDAIGGLWDIAPGTVLIPEAGGKISDLGGLLPMSDSRVVVGTNAELHQEVLALMQRCYRGFTGFR